jgi:hypothetical protein
MSYVTRVSDHFVNTVCPTFQRKWDNPLVDKVIKIACAIFVLATFVLIGLYAALRGLKKSYGALETGYCLSFESKLEKKLSKKRALINEYFGKIKIKNSNPLSLTMKGMSLIATGLKNKHHLKDLFVVEGRDSLISLLKKRKEMSGNQRFAIIVPYFSLVDQKIETVASWQHKICIGVEIHDGCINFYNFDSEPNLYRHKYILDYFVEIYGSELVSDYLIGTKRSVSYGCAVFALKDAVNFLKNENFKSNIQTEVAEIEDSSETPLNPESRKPFDMRTESCEETKETEETQAIKSNSLINDPPQPNPTDLTTSSEKQTHLITHIPAEFMKGCQSLSKISDYQKTNPNKELSLKVRKHRRKVRGKWQNHYLTHRIQKYQNLVLDLVKKLSSEDLECRISETFIKEPILVRTISA